MTDAPTAPTSSAPPAATEVPVNADPFTMPTPIGSQAPDKPVGDVEGSSHRPQSRAEQRQEAIKKAFARADDQSPADKPADKAADKAADKRTDKSADKAVRAPAKAQAKAEAQDRAPAKAEAEVKPERYREGGRFARQPAAEGAPEQSATEAPAPAKPAPLPKDAPYREPPARISEQAKADWAGTPESVRGDIHRMQQEFGEAYKQYRADNETMNTIRPYHQMAQQHGTTLDRALYNYVNMEQQLRADPMRGLETIVNNLNLRDPSGKKLSLHDLAMHIVRQTPEQHQMRLAQNAQGALTNQLGQLNQRLNQIDQRQQEMQDAARTAQTREQIDAFADTHPRFDELHDLIVQEINLGFDLTTAYRRAELLRPSTQADQTRTTSAQTRQSDRSISGSPSAGGSVSSSPRKPGKPVSRLDAIQNAMKRANGSI